MLGTVNVVGVPEDKVTAFGAEVSKVLGTVNVVGVLEDKVTTFGAGALLPLGIPRPVDVKAMLEGSLTFT